jgi:hypothetical protein
MSKAMLNPAERDTRSRKITSEEPGTRDRRFSRVTALIAGLILAGATAAIAATAIDWSAVSEPKLVFAGGAPQPPLFQVKIEDGKHFFQVTTRPIFKNLGFKSGSIQRVAVVPVGLKQYPMELKVLHLDTSAIGWMETKEVRCEFLSVIDSTDLEPNGRLEFRIYFYGPGDEEIYWEGMTIENVESRSSLTRRARRHYVESEGSFFDSLVVA